VFEEAKKLDEAIGSDNLDEGPLLDTTDEALQRVLSSLTEVLPRKEKPETTETKPEKRLKPSDAGKIDELLGNLSGFLENNDLEAEDAAKEIAEYLAGTRYESDIREITELLDEFDFNTALEKGKNLQEKVLKNG
jgi:hypothetical protein